MPTLFVKTTNFQLVFHFEQTCTVTILFGEHGIMAHTMMAMPIRALVLHYPMIQFLIKYHTLTMQCSGELVDSIEAKCNVVACV